MRPQRVGPLHAHDFESDLTAPEVAQPSHAADDHHLRAPVKPVAYPRDIMKRLPHSAAGGVRRRVIKFGLTPYSTSSHLRAADFLFVPAPKLCQIKLGE